jgi:hypothetical protein
MNRLAVESECKTISKVHQSPPIKPEHAAPRSVGPRLTFARHVMKPLIGLDLVQHAMKELGFELVQAQPGTMDSGFAEFSDGSISITIWKDKGIWEFGGKREELEPLGVWRGYSATADFIAALTDYAKLKQKAEPAR